MAGDQLEQWRQRILRPFGGLGDPALFGGAVKNREIELFVGGIQRGEQIEDLVEDFVGAGIGPVDLVDDDDRLEPACQHLGQHEFGLRHRAFRGIDQQQAAVDHRQHALDLAAEIGMAGSVDDIQPHAFPFHRRAFGENGNAAFALQVAGIQRLFLDLLVVAIDAGLAQHAVDHRGLAMVDMGNNGDIAQVPRGIRSVSHQVFKHQGLEVGSVYKERRAVASNLRCRAANG